MISSGELLKSQRFDKRIEPRKRKSNNTLHEIAYISTDTIFVSPDIKEDILSDIKFGRWNVLFIIGMCLGQLSAPVLYYSSVFINMPTSFRCNDTNTTNIHNEYYDNSCKIMQNSSYNFSLQTPTTECKNYEYDTSMFKNTFTSEFNLVCDKAWLSSSFQMLVVAGNIIGNAFSGLSDKWGRVTMIRIASVIYAFAILMIGFAPGVTLILIARFLAGFAYPILNGSAYALAMETTPPQYRSVVGFVVFLPFSLSTMLMGTMSYFIREWRILHLICSAPVYIIPFVSIFMDKSPRWLIQQDRLNEAYASLEKASKMNNSPIKSKDEIFSQMKYIQKCSSNNDDNESKGILSVLKEKLKLLLGSKTMCKIFLITPLVWFFMAILYFGVPLNANSFTRNVFFYIIITGAVRTPGPLIGPVLTKRFGNIKTAIVLFAVTGACMLAILMISESFWWFKWILVTISMAAIAAVCAICYLFTTELFPTSVRTTGVGICFVFYYFGFFFGSYINSLDLVSAWWLFNAVCGFASVTAAFLVSFLPETHGLPLCETFTEMDENKNSPEDVEKNNMISVEKK